MSLMNKCVCLVLMSALLVLAPLGGVRRATAADDTELAKKMEGINDHLKKLRKSLKDPALNAESLETLSKVQEATVASKSLIPAKAATVPEKDRAKFVTGYRKDMNALLQHLCKVEMALLDNDNAKAEEMFKDLKKIEDDGHEKYSDE